MAFAGTAALTELWSKVKSNFGRSLGGSAASTTYDIKLEDASGTTLDTQTIPAATISSAGVMTAADKTKLNGIAAGATAVSESTVSGWGFTKSSGSYSKPSGGIPVTDLASDVQTSLGKADTALQEHQSLANYYTKTETGTAITNAIGGLDVSNITANLGAGKTITALSQTDGKISATASDIVITKSQVSDFPTSLPASNVTNSYFPTGTAPISGKGVAEAIQTKAPLTNPTFGGTPCAPTAAAGTNTTQIATTEFVNSAIATAQTGAALFQGTITANTTISNAAYKKGMYWVVNAAGTYVGQTCEVGDMIFCVKDKGSAYAASDFSVVQNNIVEMTAAEVDAICV